MISRTALVIIRTRAPRGHDLPTTIKDIIVGKARDPMDPRIFHTSPSPRSSPGWASARTGCPRRPTAPRRPSRLSATHAYLAVWLAVLTAFTVFIISLAYSQGHRALPGGRRRVPRRDQAPRAERSGVVSGCALVVDYVLTISISIASGVRPDLQPSPADWQAGSSGLKFVVGLISSSSSICEASRRASGSSCRSSCSSSARTPC